MLIASFDEFASKGKALFLAQPVKVRNRSQST
jgi:hypothetical protein